MNFSHAFSPEFSWAMVVVVVAAVAAAYFFGLATVYVRPRRYATGCGRREDEPRFVQVRTVKLRRKYRNSLKINNKPFGESTICFASKSIQKLATTAVVAITTFVFMREHGTGLYQLILNAFYGLEESKGIAMFWTYVLATAICSIVGYLFWYVQKWSADNKAEKLFRSYLYKNRVVPGLHEQVSLSFVIAHTVWAIKSTFTEEHELADNVVEFRHVG